jgi:chromosomal replication initiation ATPase DnaA
MKDETLPRQLPLALTHGEARSRDDLVVTAANEQAVALIECWPDWPAQVIILVGPAGSGKTHLADIWCAEAGARRFAPEAIGEDAIHAAAEGPVLVDNADARNLDQTGLFHLINAIKGAGTQLLLTARSFSGAWGVELPDLASRLRAAATVEINEPDDMLLAGVIVKLFADRQVIIEPHVVQFLVRRMERSLSAAREVVALIDQMAMERKIRITRGLASEAAAMLEQRQRPA